MTKSKRIGRGGTRKGAGRPSTGKTAHFSTRLTRETRDLLEAESKRSGKTLSVTAERLLRRALEEAAERRRPESMRTLFRMMELLVFRLQGYGLDRAWQRSPYLFVAFREAVVGLLDALRPVGEIVAPPPVTARFLDRDAEIGHELFGGNFTHKYPESPEEYGRELLRNLLFDMDALDSRRSSHAGDVKGGGKWVTLSFDEDEDPREYYAISHARERLGLPLRGRRK